MSMSADGPGPMVMAVKWVVPANAGETNFPAVHTPTGLVQSGPSE